MAMALSSWSSAGSDYVRAPPSGPNPHGFLGDRTALSRRGQRPARDWLDTARARHPAEAVEGARAVLRIMGVFGAITVFWALFDQTGSSWVLQGTR